MSKAKGILVIALLFPIPLYLISAELSISLAVLTMLVSSFAMSKPIFEVGGNYLLNRPWLQTIIMLVVALVFWVPMNIPYWLFLCLYTLHTPLPLAAKFYDEDEDLKSTRDNYLSMGLNCRKCGDKVYPAISEYTRVLFYNCDECGNSWTVKR